MPWHKTTFPLSTEINPDVVKIGNLGWTCYHRSNNAEGFGMFHATRGMHGEPDSNFIVYLSPVASELCPEILESYTFEPCEVPARDEQDIAFVLGDPRSMGLLQETEQAQSVN